MLPDGTQGRAELGGKVAGGGWVLQFPQDTSSTST